MNINLQEILCCHDWAIEPVAGQQLYSALMTAIASHQDGADEASMQKTAGYFLSKQKSEAGKLYVGDIHRIENRLYWRDEELADDDQIVNVVVIEGAVTRNGGACTYGSKEHRDQILYANTIPQVVGHIFLINTPGGMVSAMPDYTLAFENCRESKKPTVAFIDGMCYSAGEWIACQCDRVIAMNPEDGFGCIGAMSCGELAPHGSVNAVTQERTFILVGKASPDKNIEAIEASKGNDELMQANADRNTEKFHEVVRAGRPMVTDDLLTGKTFEAREVMGRLVDEIGDFNRAINAVFELAAGSLTPARDMEVVPGEHQEDGTDDKPEGEDALGGLSEQQKAAIATSAGTDVTVDNGHVFKPVQTMFGEIEREVATPNKNKENMTEQEMKAQEAQGAQAAEQQAQEQQAQEQQAQEQEAQGAGEAQEQQSEEGAQEGASEEGASEEGAAGEGASEENESEEGQSEEGAQEEGAAGEGHQSEEQQQEQQSEEGAQASQENIENTEQEIDKIAETLHNAEQMIADKDKEIASLKEALATLNGIAEERDAAVQERNDISASLEKAGQDYAEQGKALSEAETKIAEHVATIEKLTKQVADLKAEVKELAGKPAPMTDEKSGIPADNGTGDAPEATGAVKSIVSADMSPEEIRKALREQDAKAKAKRMRQ